MYVSIGPAAVVRRRDIIGIFDLDNATWSHRTRKSLAVCEKQGAVVTVGGDLPRSLLVCSPRERPGAKRRKKSEHAPMHTVYITQLSTATLQKRLESEQI